MTKKDIVILELREQRNRLVEELKAVNDNRNEILQAINLLDVCISIGKPTDPFDFFEMSLSDLNPNMAGKFHKISDPNPDYVNTPDPPLSPELTAKVEQFQRDVQEYVDTHPEQIVETQPRTFEPRVCVVCGREFTPTNNIQKYCTPKCRGRVNIRAVPPPPENTCKHCGEGFTPVRKKQVFCSKNCNNQYHRAKRRTTTFTLNPEDLTAHLVPEDTAVVAMPDTPPAPKPRTALDEKLAKIRKECPVPKRPEFQRDL